jgi:hypothetical protein
VLAASAAKPPLGTFVEIKLVTIVAVATGDTALATMGATLVSTPLSVKAETNCCGLLDGKLPQIVPAPTLALVQ